MLYTLHSSSYFSYQKSVPLNTSIQFSPFLYPASGNYKSDFSYNEVSLPLPFSFLPCFYLFLKISSFFSSFFPFFFFWFPSLSFFQIWHICDNIHYLSFSVWLILLNIMSSCSIHVVTNSRMSFFLWLNNIPLIICHVFLIHSSGDGHLYCFHIFPVINNTS